MADLIRFTTDATENSHAAVSCKLSADMWQLIGESRERITGGKELRSNAFFGPNGLTPEGKKLMESLGVKDEKGMRENPYDGLQDIEILNRELKAAKRVTEHYYNKGLLSEKTELTRLLGHAFGKDEQASLLDEMRLFETRAWASGIAKEEVAQTYREISRILQAGGNTPLTHELRKQVAQEALRHCAIPTIISQGSHNTCNVTAIEARTYSLYPAKAAKLVADIATTGEHRTKTGIKVVIDKQSFTPDSEAMRSAPDKGFRDYATQLFNLAAVNIWYSAVKPGRHYEQTTKRISGELTAAEHVTDCRNGRHIPVLDPVTKKPLDGPYLSADQIAFISDAVVGHHEPFAVLSMGPKSLTLPDEKRQSVHAADIVDEPHLPEILETLKKRGLLPAIAAVDTSVNPLNEDSGLGMFGAGGGHVISISDYSSGKHPRASIDNEWSTKEDHLDQSVDGHELFLCMAGRDVARLDAFVTADDAQKQGKIDPFQELRRIRYDGQNGWSMEPSGKEAGDVISRAANAERNLKGETRHEWFDELVTIINTVPVPEKMSLLKRVQAAKVCTANEFGRVMANAAQSISLHKSEAAKSADEPKRAECIRATADLIEFLITLPADVKKDYFAAMRGI